MMISTDFGVHINLQFVAAMERDRADRCCHAERGSSGNFYSASKALDEIKLGLQKDCSTAASTAKATPPV